MLILILLVAIILSIICYKTKRTELFQLFRVIAIIIGVLTGTVIFIWGIMDYGYNSSKLQDYRQKLKKVQEEMKQVKEEIIEADALDNEILDEFLENYQELENKEQEYEADIENMTAWLEKGGGKEIAEYWLFFNLF